MSTWQHNFAEAGTERAAAYDRLLVPSLFHPWACLLAGELNIREGWHALDVACGPGTLTRVLAGLVGPGGSVTGTDISPAMLDAARAKPPAAGAPQHYALTGAAPLEEIPDGAFQVTCCQHGLQFFPDRAAAVSEWYRVTAPGGLVAVAVWAPLDDNPLFATLHDAAAAVLGLERAAGFRLPWSLAAAEVASLLDKSGFTEVRCRRRTLPTVFPGGTEDLRTVYRFSPAAGDIQALDSTATAVLHQEISSRIGPYVQDNAVIGPTRAEFIIARRPGTP